MGRNNDMSKELSLKLQTLTQALQDLVTALAAEMTKQAEPASEQKYLTSQELADRLRTTREVIANWRFAGKGPRYINVGGRKVLYALNDVSEWEDKNKKRSTIE